MNIKYPHIIVTLSGEDGNAFRIIGSVTRAMSKNNVSKEEINKFTDLCMSGDYDHLLRTCMEWVDVR